MDRGDIYWIRRSYRLWNKYDFRFVTEDDDRPAVCLLTKDRAQALGSQLLMLGSTKKQGAPALAFQRPFRYEGGHRDSQRVMGIWKTWQLICTPFLGAKDRRGVMIQPLEWSTLARNRFRIAIQDEIECAEILSEHHRPPWTHPQLKACLPGGIIRYRDHLLYVLSCRALQQNHPHGPIIAAPILPHLQSNVAIHCKHGRIAYEFTQSIEPLADEELEIVETATTSSLLDRARNQCISLLDNSSMKEASEAELLAYLHLAGSDSFPDLAGSTTPKGFDTRGQEVIHRRLPTTGRANTGGFAVGGEDRFKILPEFQLFHVWLEREERKISLVVESKNLDHNEIESLVIESSTDILELYGDAIVQEYGVVRVPVGFINEDLRTDLSVCVASLRGLEASDLEIHWGGQPNG